MSTPGQIATGVVGAVVGYVVSGFNPVGAIYGASIGLTLGGILFPASADISKPAPASLQMQTSQYGITVPVLYGTRKLSGNLIWYGNFQTHEIETSAGGKGGGGASSTSYTYSVSLAFGLCIADGATLITSWAGKDVLLSSRVTFCDGTQTTPDSHIQAILTGLGKTRFPVWKGLCYVVLRNFDLGGSPYIPQFAFEVQKGTTAGRSLTGAGDGFTTFGIKADGSLYGWGLNTGYQVGDGTATITFSPVQVHGVGNVGFLANVVSVSNSPYHSLACDSSGNAYAWGTGSAVLGQGGTPPDFRTTPALVKDAAGTGYLAGITKVAAGESHSLFLDSAGNVWACGAGGCLGQGDDVGSALPVKVKDTAGTGYLSAITDISASDLCSHAVDSSGNLWTWGTNGHLGDGTTDDQFLPVKVKIQEDSTDITDVAQVCSPSICVKNDGTVWTWGHNGFGQLGDNTTDFQLSAVQVHGVGDVGYLANCVEVSTDPQGTCTALGSNGRVYAWGDSSSGQLGQGDHVEWHTPVIVKGTGGVGYLEGIISLASNNSTCHALQSNGTAWGWGWNYHGCIGDNTSTLRHYPVEALESWAVNADPDALPSDVTQDILTNDFYGLGLSSTYLDSTVFSTTRSYCVANDLYVSMIFNQQMSVLDCLQYVIQHHNGYITYADGLISHHQLSASDPPVAALVESSFVKNQNQPYIEINTKGDKDISNKIIIEYTKRDADYVVGTALADDMVDISARRLRESVVRLDGLTTFSRASIMANLLLVKGLSNPLGLSFKLGPKNLDAVKPGTVVTITDSLTELTALPARILAIRENENYEIEIDSQEEIGSVYQYTTQGTDTSTPPVPPALNADAVSVIGAIAAELPALYSDGSSKYGVSYSKPTGQQFAGSSLYESFSSGGSYERKEVSYSSGITGVVSAVGFVNDEAYMDITLDSDATLTSAVDFDSLMITPRLNLGMVRTTTGDMFLRFETATLIGTNQWKISGFIYDTVGFPMTNTYGSAAVADKIIMLTGLPFLRGTLDSEKFRTIYLKVAAFNFSGTEQTLAGVIEIPLAIADLFDKPLAPCNISVNSVGVDSSSAISVLSGNITITWVSRNRLNSGGTVYDRADATLDDTDFQSFGLEIYQGATLLRTVSQTTKSFIYTSAMQTTDGGPFPSYIVKVKQVGTIQSSDWSDSITITVL